MANEFQRMLLAASLQSAREDSNPLRLNNFSASFRELFRHILVGLAPERSVSACMWFEPDPLAKGKVTRSQKVAFVIHGGLDPEYVTDELGIDIAAERKGLLKCIDRLNKFTHVNEDSFGSAPEEVEKQVLDACEALESFLDCADEARRLLCSRVEERIHDDVVSEAIGDTIQSLDELATHHCIEDVDVYEVEITLLDHEKIHFTAHGSVGVQLQWGSNSDVRRDEGAVIQDSYPLTCQFFSRVAEPEQLEVVQNSLCVDTSSWWDSYCDEEPEPEGAR
nr:hypothetical protein [Roseateles albus]